LDIEIWNLFGPILRSGGACKLLFPVYPDLGPFVENSDPNGKDFLLTAEQFISGKATT
jgi:hypothetical protein